MIYRRVLRTLFIVPAFAGLLVGCSTQTESELLEAAGTDPVIVSGREFRALFGIDSGNHGFYRDHFSYCIGLSDFITNEYGGRNIISNKYIESTKEDEVTGGKEFREKFKAPAGASQRAEGENNQEAVS